MPWRLAKTSWLALLSVCTLCSCNPLSSFGHNSEAEQVVREAMSRCIIECGGRTFFTDVFGWKEIKGLSYSITEHDLTDTDKLNNTEWSGTVHVTCTSSRGYEAVGRRWGDWVSGMLGKFGPDINSYRVQKRDGEWFIGVYALTPAAPVKSELNCDKVPK